MSDCVRCGFCCKQRSCGYAPWDEEKGQCSALIQSGIQYYCAEYRNIVKDPMSEISPAFGAGCCATLFNIDRERVLVSLNRG